MIYLIIIIFIVALDQITKYYFNKKYKLNQFHEVIKDKLYFTNIRNKGAAYGILNKNPVILKILSCISLFIVGFGFLKSLKESAIIPKLGFSFVLGGAIGNVYDRFKKNYVTDFIYIKFKKAPIFNIADIFVLLGVLITFFSISDKTITKR